MNGLMFNYKETANNAITIRDGENRNFDPSMLKVALYGNVNITMNITIFLHV